DLTPVARRDLLHAVAEETERLDRLVRNLLDMTRLESGAVRIHKDWTSIEEVIGGALDRMESRLLERKVTATVPGDLVAPCDPVLIEQVLVNLLENAAKYTPPGTPVDVCATKDDGEVIVEVADRGPGVAQSEQLRIFEKFQRGGGTGRAKAGVG